MARLTGKDLALKWVTSSGTFWLETDFRSLTISEDQESADATAGGDTYKAYIATFADATGEVQLLDTAGTAGTALWAALAPSTSGTLTWYQDGTAAGHVYSSAPAFISNREREFPYDDVVAITAGFQFTAAPTDGTV
jgi:hypothetical protein